VVVSTTAGAEVLSRLTGSNRVGGVFQVGILVTSYLVGSGPGYMAALLSFLIYNLFVGQLSARFNAYTAEDVLVLLSFLAVAMLMGNLTGRLRDEAKRAEARARATAVLFEATREFSATNDAAVIRARLTDHLATAARGKAFVVGGDSEYWSGDDPPPPMVLSAARGVMAKGETPDIVEAAGWSLRSLAEGGVAGWTSEERPEPEEEALLQILADAGSAAIARAQLALAKSEAEARARTEDLRNALLSSISHDLRTPLAAVLASATALQEFGDRFDTQTRGDLINTIQEEAERLNASVTNLLNMTRLESGALDARSTPFDLSEVVDRTRRRFERMKGKRTITWQAGADADHAVGDPVLFEVALGNVLENAVRYSPEGGVIAMASALRDGQVVLAVTDEGPGVPRGELERLFDKFYRGSGAKQMPGTGLGLSIVRGVMQGMGGSATAEIRRDAASGLVVSLALPAEA
jgi:two-component system sensor histidine kinase KdpD